MPEPVGDGADGRGREQCDETAGAERDANGGGDALVAVDALHDERKVREREEPTGEEDEEGREERAEPR